MIKINGLSGQKEGGGVENPPKKWMRKVRQMKDGIHDLFRRNINSNRKKYEYPMSQECMPSRTGQLQFKKLNFIHAKIRKYVKHSVLISHFKKTFEACPDIKDTCFEYTWYRYMLLLCP
jgi:hypothetical protein